MPKAAKVTKPKLSTVPFKLAVEEACYNAPEAKGVTQLRMLKFGEEEGYFIGNEGRIKAQIARAVSTLLGEGRLVQNKQSYALSEKVFKEYEDLNDESSEEEEPVKKTPKGKKKVASTPKTQSAPKKKKAKK